MNKRAKVDRRDRGFALASLILFTMVATMFVVATIPLYRLQAKRRQEEELIFRGEEYVRAIQKYQRKFKTYPLSIDALLNTNGERFLRKAYTDPITEKPFRTIYINPDGSLTGSTLFSQPQKLQNPVVEQFYNQQAAQAQQPEQKPAPGAWVIGVTSESEMKSIKLYNGRGIYNEWEFIAILQAAQQKRP
jgi:type II secretory pathway pseudopilin PulG